MQINQNDLHRLIFSSEGEVRDAINIHGTIFPSCALREVFSKQVIAKS